MTESGGGDGNGGVGGDISEVMAVGGWGWRAVTMMVATTVVSVAILVRWWWWWLGWGLVTVVVATSTAIWAGWR